jgi:BTB/POZ domain
VWDLPPESASTERARSRDDAVDRMRRARSVVGSSTAGGGPTRDAHDRRRRAAAAGDDDGGRDSDSSIVSVASDCKAASRSDARLAGDGRRRQHRSRDRESPEEKGDAIVRFDVGGQIFRTRRRTVVRRSATGARSLLAMRVEGHSGAGPVFIDRSPKHFDCILQYLRGEDVHLRGLTSAEVLAVAAEAKYYRLMDLVERLIPIPSSADVEREQLQRRSNLLLIEGALESAGLHEMIGVLRTTCTDEMMNDWVRNEMYTIKPPLPTDFERSTKEESIARWTPRFVGIAILLAAALGRDLHNQHPDTAAGKSPPPPLGPLTGSPPAAARPRADSDTRARSPPSAGPHAESDHDPWARFPAERDRDDALPGFERRIKTDRRPRQTERGPSHRGRVERKESPADAAEAETLAAMIAESQAAYHRLHPATASLGVSCRRSPRETASESALERDPASSVS